MQNTEQTTEIAKGLTLTEVMSVYFDENAMVERPMPLFRIDNNGHRNYYSVSPEGEITMYTGVTTMISKTLPTSPYLIDWKVDLGKEESEKVTKEKSDYGTFMHIQCSELMIARKYDLDLVDERLPDYLIECGHPVSLAKRWSDDMKSDILAFARFVLDHNVVPIAVEITLASKKGYAGTLDIVAAMDIEEKGFWGEVYASGDRKGLPKEGKRKKRIRAIIDMKSGKKGFWESHEIQLHAYKDMWEENFPEKPVDKVFNWSPKDWRTAPDYNLKDQTDSANAQKLVHLIQLAAIEEAKRESKIAIYEGVIKLENDITTNYRTISLMDLLKAKREEIKPKESAGFPEFNTQE
jgi:hypothetical protein